MPLNSCDKCLKSLFDKFLSNESRLEFMNCILQLIKIKFLLIVKAMYFSNPFGYNTYFYFKLTNILHYQNCHSLSKYEELEERF